MVIEQRRVHFDNMVQEHESLETALSLTSTSSTGSIPIVVFLPNDGGMEFQVEDGKNASCTDLLNLLIAERHFPLEFKEFFSLWLVSPLLRVQLKPNHVPFRMCLKWPQYLRKFTLASDEDVLVDEPVVKVMKNSFIPLAEERALKNPAMIELLFNEARNTYLEGRYPLGTVEAYDRVAAILAHLELGVFSAQQHTLNYLKPHMLKFYPVRQYETREGVVWRRNQLEQKLLEQFSQRTTATAQLDLHKEFLEECRSLPFYGAAFFDAQLERPVGRMGKIKNHYDVEVWVAVNREGICIIDKKKSELLLGLPYKQISWNIAEPIVDDTTVGLPCIVLQFQGQLLQIFTRQALMMDAYIDSCVMGLRNVRGDDLDGGNKLSDSFSRLNSQVGLRNQLDKLCLRPVRKQ